MVLTLLHALSTVLGFIHGLEGWDYTSRAVKPLYTYNCHVGTTTVLHYTLIETFSSLKIKQKKSFRMHGFGFPN